MRFSEILTASVVVAPLVAAHGDHFAGMPKIVGLGGKNIDIRNLKSRNVFEAHAERAAGPEPKPRVHQLHSRQGGIDGACGPANGGACCDEGYCCSPAVCDPRVLNSE